MIFFYLQATVPEQSKIKLYKNRKRKKKTPFFFFKVSANHNSPFLNLSSIDRKKPNNTRKIIASQTWTEKSKQKLLIGGNREIKRILTKDSKNPIDDRNLQKTTYRFQFNELGVEIEIEIEIENFCNY